MNVFRAEISPIQEKKRFSTEPEKFRISAPNYFRFRRAKIVSWHFFRAILSSVDFIEFRNLATEPFLSSANWFVVSYIIYESVESSVTLQKVSLTVERFGIFVTKRLVVS